MSNAFELANLKRRVRELEEYNDDLEGRLMELEETKVQEDIQQVLKEKIIEKSKA